MGIAASTRPLRPDGRVVSSNLDLDDSARLLLRLTLGALMLLHGIAKLIGGIAGIQGMLAKAGLPPALGYLVYLGEVVAPLLLIVGLWTRAAALVVAVNMVVAVALVHMAQFGSLAPTGGWTLELQAFYFVVAVAVAMLGAGRFSVGGTGGRWN